MTLEFAFRYHVITEPFRLDERRYFKMKSNKCDRDLLAAVESTDKKLLPLFRRAVARDTSDLENLLAAHAVTHHGDGSAVYHCMARDQYVHGHNHHGAQRVADGKAQPRDFQFYGNPLTVDEKGSGTTWTKPSSRAALGEHLFYTFEFDCEEAGFLS